ncbi:hypothetical protein B0O99DRAFT_598768 [Bisporella sp. PMI_857]|nr:hypothetical protein B0O99DRAFT_598768 [Bisporella sp. PMI_857]
MAPQYVWIVYSQHTCMEEGGNHRSTESTDAVYNSLEGANSHAKRLLHRKIKRYGRGNVTSVEETRIIDVNSRADMGGEETYLGVARLRPSGSRKNKVYEILYSTRAMEVRTDIPAPRSETPDQDAEGESIYEEGLSGGDSSGPEAEAKEHTKPFAPPAPRSTCLSGKTFAFTGQGRGLERAESMSIVHRHGGTMVEAEKHQQPDYLITHHDGDEQLVREVSKRKRGKRTFVIDKGGLVELVKSLAGLGGAERVVGVDARDKDENGPGRKRAKVDGSVGM